jgi:hypothetical protein
VGIQVKEVFSDLDRPLPEFMFKDMASMMDEYALNDRTGRVQSTNSLSA